MKLSVARASFLTAVLLSFQGQAATVTSTADSGPGSLRDAIAAAAPGETVSFAVGGMITLTSGELVINKDLVVAGPGATNLTLRRSVVGGTPDFRIFNINGGVVRISGLTMSNGSADVGGGINSSTACTLLDCVLSGNSATVAGGGLNNLSTLTMSNCVIRGNSVVGSTNDASGGGFNNEGTITALNCSIISNSVAAGASFGGFGGGVNNDGTLSVTNSIISGNSAAAGSGGGMFNSGTLTLSTSTVGDNSARSAGSGAQGGGVANDLGTVILERSTVSGNVAVGTTASGSGRGAGVFNNMGSVTVESSTVSGNTAQSDPGLSAAGGGLFNNVGAVLILHSTIAANGTSGSGLSDAGGLANAGGVVEIKDTILAANTAAIDLFNDPLGLTLSDGHNLFGATNGPFALGTNDQFNLTAGQVRLGPLQNNGGPTFTHALLCGSPAIDAGDNSDAPASDQRGFPRIVRGVIDIGAYEDSNTAPTITCPGAITNCISSATQPVTVSANVADADGDSLVVVWIVDGSFRQTNSVPAGGPPTAARVDFTALLSPGPHTVNVSVTDTKDCSAACSTTVTVQFRGDLYPIALSAKNLAGVPVGGVIADIYNGVQPGNFGWLTWAGSPNEPTLVVSLTPPGNSSTYVNPLKRTDHVVSIGDWVRGKPGVTNSDKVRKALDTLKTTDIVVPVWDRATGRGNNSLYHVVAFARVRILDYHLPNQNRITARFLGLADCD